MGALSKSNFVIGIAELGICFNFAVAYRLRSPGMG